MDSHFYTRETLCLFIRYRCSSTILCVSESVCMCVCACVDKNYEESRTNVYTCLEIESKLAFSLYIYHFLYSHHPTDGTENNNWIKNVQASPNYFYDPNGISTEALIHNVFFFFFHRPLHSLSPILSLSFMAGSSRPFSSYWFYAYACKYILTQFNTKQSNATQRLFTWIDELRAFYILITTKRAICIVCFCVYLVLESSFVSTLYLCSHPSCAQRAIHEH